MDATCSQHTDDIANALIAICGRSRQTPPSMRSAACGEARRPAAIRSAGVRRRRVADERFVENPLVERVLRQGDTKSSVRLRGGFQADLRLVVPKSRGAAMAFHRLEGAQIALRDRAIDRGFKLNEYGLFQTADDARVAGTAEEEILRGARNGVGAT